MPIYFDSTEMAMTPHAIQLAMQDCVDKGTLYLLVKPFVLEPEVYFVKQMVQEQEAVVQQTRVTVPNCVFHVVMR